MKIVTVSGTQVWTVRTVLSELGADVTVIGRLSEAKRAKFDALMLLGGADITPYLYGERTTYADPPDVERDKIEYWLARHALTHGLPIFGICRGHQMLAVAAGGALYQDIWRETHVNHASAHPLYYVKGPIADYLPTRKVNSLHHQAIKKVPFGFDVVARTEDGTIEAIWRPGYLGVQFHPEIMFYDGDERWLKLFDWFVNGRLA